MLHQHSYSQDMVIPEKALMAHIYMDHLELGADFLKS